MMAPSIVGNHLCAMGTDALHCVNRDLARLDATILSLIELRTTLRAQVIHHIESTGVTMPTLPPPETYGVFIVGPAATSYIFNLTADTTIGRLCKRIAAELDIPTAEQRLFFRNVELADALTLGEAGIAGEDTIYVVSRL